MVNPVSLSRSNYFTLKPLQRPVFPKNISTWSRLANQLSVSTSLFAWTMAPFKLSLAIEPNIQPTNYPSREALVTLLTSTCRKLKPSPLWWLSNLPSLMCPLEEPRAVSRLIPEYFPKESSRELLANTPWNLSRKDSSVLPSIVLVLIWEQTNKLWHGSRTPTRTSREKRISTPKGAVLESSSSKVESKVELKVLDLVFTMQSASLCPQKHFVMQLASKN